MDIDVDRAFAAHQQERAGQEQREADWAQRRAICPHNYTLLRSFSRETPDDGVVQWDVFYCRGCLDQQMRRAVR